MAEVAGATVASPSGALVRVPILHRLYFRIYLALLLSLVLAAVLVTVAWRLNADSSQIGPSLDTFAEFAVEVLPPASADKPNSRLLSLTGNRGCAPTWHCMAPTAA